MQFTDPSRLTAHLETVIGLARVLERVEDSSTGFDAGQYRVLVGRLAEALKAAEPGELLHAVLGRFPAAAQLYENLNYEHAGLCCAPLEASLNAELQATQAIERARRGEGRSAA